MNESANSNNSMALREAQELILEFARDYFDEKVVADVVKVIRECPIYFVDPKDDDYMGDSRDEVCDRKSVEAYVSKAGIFLPNYAMSYSKTAEFDRDVTIGVIIHEYAHVLREINSDYGNMFEEGFATVFAESCIIHSELKKQTVNGQKLEQPSVLSHVVGKYAKAVSQIRSILYILNQNGLDMKLMGEYIFGNQDVFKQKCVDILGKEFATYFDLANSSRDQYYNDYDNKEQNSEIMLIHLISNYIKQKGLNISNYWDRNHIVQYNRSAETLCKGVVSAGITSVREEDKDTFKNFEWQVKVINQESANDISDRIDRIKSIIAEKFTLSGKSKEEVYHTIYNLCGEYFNRVGSNKKENKLFIEELKKVVPNLDGLVRTFVDLRSFTTSPSLLDGLDVANGISYQQISSFISASLEQYEFQQTVDNLKTIFNNCNTKEKLLSAISEINKYTNKVDLEQLFPNYNDFCVFVGELGSQISDILDFEIKWNYETLYNKMLESYVFKKEQDLACSKDMEESYNASIESIDKQYKAVSNEDEFNRIHSKNANLNHSLSSKQQNLENENQKRAINQTKRDEMLSRKSELQRKNAIIRFFKRKEIKSLSIQIDAVEKELHGNDINLENIRATISGLQSEIKSNEQQLIDLCGLNISEYNSILEKCKLENLTQNQLLERAVQIKKQLESLEISRQEQELQNLYKKNGMIRQEDSIQQENSQRFNR